MRQFRYSKISNFPNYADSWSSAILMLSNFKGSQFMHFLYTIHTSTINFYMSSSSFHYHLVKCTTFSFLFTISCQCRSLTDWLIDIFMRSIFLIYPQLKKSKSWFSKICVNMVLQTEKSIDSVWVVTVRGAFRTESNIWDEFFC